MLVQDVMTTSLDSIKADASVFEASRKMQKDDVGCLAVFEKDEAIGLISDRDIVVRCVSLGSDPKKTKVRDVMSGNLISCQSDDTVETAARRMKEQKIRRLIVRDDHGTPIGVLSLGDLAARAHEKELVGAVMEEVCYSR